MPDDTKIREDRLRRMAERYLLRLEKSRRRDPRAPDFGRYMVVDHTNTVVLGGYHHEYSATLDDVETFPMDADTRPGFRKGADGVHRWTNAAASV